jgi:uncharacterized protein
MNLKEFFQKYPRAALAFSGGVDSTYLLAEAARYAQNIRAYTVVSSFQPHFEQEDASRLAKQLGIAQSVIPVDVLASDNIRANPVNRCYYCKKAVFTAIRKAAEKDGFTIILDGTNASDEAADRPGMKVLQELDILSPLRLCGLTKKEIRRRSQELRLPTWNKPAYACLATRIPANEPITAEKLERTEWAENFLMTLGFRDFRVRFFHNCAKLQVTRPQLSLVKAHRKEILSVLRTRYDEVLLDLEVRP